MAKHRKRRNPNREEFDGRERAQSGAGNSLDDDLLHRLSETLGDDFEIIGLEEEVWDVTIQVTTPSVSLSELLESLIQEEEVPPREELYALSDLSLPDMELLRRQWPLVPVRMRRDVLAELLARAEQDLFLALGRALRVFLEDSDAQVRQMAVRGLWDDGGPDLIGPLVQMVHNDADNGVRAATATALGGFVLAGELEELETAIAMRAEEALLTILADETQALEVRRRALESIAYSSETGVRQLIEDAYYSPDHSMRVSAVFAMGRSADVRWRGLVRAELQNPSPTMRAEAAFACGELEARAALNDLLALLNDREQNVRLAAIYALGHIGGSDARDALEVVLLGDDAEEVEAAENALEEMSFYADLEAISLFDESEDEDAEWDGDSDVWYDMEDRELGEYADDYEDAADYDDDDGYEGYEDGSDEDDE